MFIHKWCVLCIHMYLNPDINYMTCWYINTVCYLFTCTWTATLIIFAVNIDCVCIYSTLNMLIMFLWKSCCICVRYAIGVCIVLLSLYVRLLAKYETKAQMVGYWTFCIVIASLSIFVKSKYNSMILWYISDERTCWCVCCLLHLSRTMGKEQVNGWRAGQWVKSRSMGKEHVNG